MLVHAFVNGFSHNSKSTGTLAARASSGHDPQFGRANQMRNFESWSATARHHSMPQPGNPRGPKTPREERAALFEQTWETSSISMMIRRQERMVNVLRRRNASKRTTAQRTRCGPLPDTGL